MKHLKRVALLGAGATVLTSAPRAVHAAPRAEPTDALAQIAAINTAVSAMREKHEAAMAGRITQEEANALVEPINAEIDRLSAALTAAQLGGGAGDSLNAAERQHSTAFATWFRQGEVDADLTALAVQAALTTQSDPDGGYLVPVDWEQRPRMADILPVRTLRPDT